MISYIEQLHWLERKDYLNQFKEEFTHQFINGTLISKPSSIIDTFTWAKTPNEKLWNGLDMDLYDIFESSCTDVNALDVARYFNLDKDYPELFI